jgi:hypothetical protein
MMVGRGVILGEFDVIPKIIRKRKLVRPTQKRFKEIPKTT